MTSQKITSEQSEIVVAKKPPSYHDYSEPKSEIHVLIIEDSATDALLIQKSLSSSVLNNFRFRCVDHFAAGIKKLEHETFDVVLLDLMLPDSDGLDTFARLYARHPDIPIVILSGIDEESVVANALRKGAQDYLNKSNFNPEILIRSIRYAIERNRRQQAERTILRTQLEERRRLARELHDGVIQSLSAMRLHLQMIDHELSRNGDAQTAGTIREVANEAYSAIQDVRLLAYDLHRSELDKRELPEVIESFGKQLEKQSGLEIEITNCFTQSLNDHIKNHLYRIVQECMRNTAKHAEASRLNVIIRDQGILVTVEVNDDGIGFDESKTSSSKTGLGLISIRERARLLGGTLQLRSQPGLGTTVLIEIPI